MNNAPQPPANGNMAPPDDVEEAILKAQHELETAAAHASFANDPMRLIFSALAALLRGIDRAYTGLRRQRSDLTTFVLKQRNDLVADFTKQHEAALLRAKADELAHQAHIKAGLIDAAKDALRELLHLDRKHTFMRTAAYAGIPAVLLLLIGTIAGWSLRGASNVAEVTDNISSLAALTEVTRQNTETIREMSDLLIHGMTATDLAALVSLHDVVLTSVAKVHSDTVPAPCIAAVPDRTIMVNNKPIKACVIALRDSAAVRGGEFLANAIPSNATR